MARELSEASSENIQVPQNLQNIKHEIRNEKISMQWRKSCTKIFILFIFVLLPLFFNLNNPNVKM